MTRLYTFAVSHFAEKARWALDYRGIPYEERVLLPGLHTWAIRRTGVAATSVPVLVHEGRAIQGSQAIIDCLDGYWPDPSPGLTPSAPDLRERALDLERWLDADVGETARLVFYHYALGARQLVTHLFAQGGPFWGQRFYRVAYPKVANAIRHLYRIEEASVARACRGASVARRRRTREREEERLRRTIGRLLGRTSPAGGRLPYATPNWGGTCGLNGPKSGKTSGVTTDNTRSSSRVCRTGPQLGNARLAWSTRCRGSR